MRRIYVAALVPIPPTENGEGSELHMWRRHSVSLAEVEQACLNFEANDWEWEDDPKRGRRLIAFGRALEGRKLRVILRPVRDRPNEFVLINAWEVSK